MAFVSSVLTYAVLIAPCIILGPSLSVLDFRLGQEGGLVGERGLVCRVLLETRQRITYPSDEPRKPDFFIIGETELHRDSSATG
jgi:hypothetical protein